MIPYVKIVKIDIERLNARTVTMADIVAFMKPPVTRVIIFELATRSPIFIIRRSLIPSDWVTEDATTKQLSMAQSHKDKTIQDYLSAIPDPNDAAAFALVMPTATLGEAAAQMRAENAHDVFVTASGQRNDVIGWLPEDRL